MNIVIGSANVDKILQNGTVSKEVGDQLYQALLYRAGAKREPWEGAVNQLMDFIVPGLFEVDTTPRTPGVTPAYQVLDYERYQARAKQYGKPTRVHMPSNYVASTSTYLEQQRALGLQAGATMNRLARNELYRCYSAGNTIVDAVAGVAVRVASLNGFRLIDDPSSGTPVPVSNVAPRFVLVNGTQIAQVVIAATPDDPAYPDGPGTLTFNAAPTIVGGDTLTTPDASEIIRPGVAQNVDGISPGQVLNMDLIGKAIAKLRTNSVQGCEGGWFHIHFDPLGESSLFADNSIQRQIEGLGLDNDPYLTYSVGRTRSSMFFSNNETPKQGTVKHLVPSRPTGAPNARGSGEVGSELININGTPIMRTIVIGDGALIEKYIDETAYMSEAGVAGRIGGMRLVHGGVEINLDGIRFITKAPSDVYNELVEMAWSWSGDYVCPSNLLSGSTPARYKRACIIESAFS